jgi:hypothetical protein
MRPAMGLVSRFPRDPTVRLAALALAAGVPLAAYLATASVHDYWLDGGEFTAQAVDLDIAHPPGHPLAGLLARLVAFLPLGPIPLRVALAQALCAAAAAAFLFSAIDTTVRSLGVARDRLAVPLALGGTWLVATSYAWWFQAVRPEVYALEALLVCVAIERVVALEAAWPTHDVRPLYTAALALGLGLANHHFIAVLAFPALAPTLARVYRARGLRPLAFCALAVALGLATYVYLPVRASTDPPMNIGDPTDFARTLWVVSARVYAQGSGLDAPQPLLERVADVVVILVEDLHGVVLLLASLGLYALLRTAGARRIGVVWLLVLVVNLGARAWLKAVRNNPDAEGYMMPGVAALGALATALVAAILARVGQRADGAPKATAVLVALVVAALGLAQLHHSAARSSLAGFHATDAFDEEQLRRLPPHAVVLAYDPQTAFRHWGVQAVERVRPDVTLVPMPFLDYPGVIDLLLARDPALAGLLRGYLFEGELRQPDIQSLAAERPLFVELDPRVPQQLYDTLLPAGLLYEVVDAGVTRSDVLDAAQAQRAVFARLYTNLAEEAREAETSRRLLWRHYLDTLYFAHFGAREPARASLERALAIQPAARELRALDAALEDTRSTRPIDIAPFMVPVP